MKVSDKVEFLPTNSLRPDPSQPRKTIDPESVESMAQTILSQGVIAPIEIDERNMIVTGEIRWRASQKAGVPIVPCRRIFGLSSDERLERQLVENLHRKDISYNERDEAIYKLFMSGRYGQPHTGQGKDNEGVITRLAGAIGLSRERTTAIIEAVEFRRRTSVVTTEVPSTIIAETRGLPDDTRVKLLEKVSEKEVKQPAEPYRIRQAVKVVKEAPELVKKKFLEGVLSLEKAVEITEVAKEAPEPMKKAVAEEKISVEQAKEATKVIKNLKEQGVEITEQKLQTQIEELSKEKSFLERRQKQSLTKMKRGFVGEAEQVPEITWSRLFCGTINNLSGARDGNITHNRIRFFAKTPSDIVCPHFWELVWATGCSFNPACAWCYLQGTFRGDITPRFFRKEELEKQIEAWFTDIEGLSYRISENISKPQVLVTGELADSLVGEHYWKKRYGIPFSQWIINLFGKQARHKVLFLTKSDKIENLLTVNPHSQAIVSFSLNAESVAQQWEKGAYAVSPIRNRIVAAKKLQDAGYEVRVRIDPMVPILGWEKQYKELVDDIFSVFTPSRVTIGSLRGLESTVRFCRDRSWVGFLAKDMTGWGRKLPDDLRLTMYSTLLNYLKQKHHFLEVGFCKESASMWKKLGLTAGKEPFWFGCKCNCVS
jgi:spore photoproduct lyase